MRPLRIGINALYLIPGGVGGTEIYLRSLLKAIGQSESKHEFFVFLNRESAADPVADPGRFHLIHCPVTALNRPARILWEQAVFPFRLRRENIDVLFSPGFTTPLVCHAPLVTVFHDLQHKRHPEFFRWFDRPFWRLLLWGAARRSRRLIAVSEATAADLERYYPGTGSKTTVVHHGVDPECFQVGELRAMGGEASKGPKYLLTVSTLHPHKNLDGLMESFAAFRGRHPEFQLTVAGLKGFAAEKLAARRAELGLGDCVTFTGWIPRDELYSLFRRADAYIAPSRFEGFGMPILEALAAGIPSACSNIAPLGQLAGGVAFLFDPLSVPQMVSAMEHITMDREFRARAAAAGPARAREFDWNTAARRTLSVLEKAAS